MVEVFIYLTKDSPANVSKITTRIKELGLTDVKYRLDGKYISATYDGNEENLRKFAETICTEFGDAIDSLTKG